MKLSNSIIGKETHDTGLGLGKSSDAKTSGFHNPFQFC